MNSYDVVVIGGGPAGLAAALAANEKGARVLVLERDIRTGGILNQCIHNGFGLKYFNEELTGPEYADRFIKKVQGTDIEVLCEAMVTSISADRVVTAISPERGMFSVKAGAVVLAMGCRERTAGAIMLAGDRPAGVYTAGMAQRLSNIEGYLVGRKVVILGSGDIGLIMARRMTYEGAKVLKVLEIMPYSTGLKRNIVQCLDDNNIPLLLSHTVTKLVGKPRLKGLYYAKVDDKMRVLPETEEYVECDTLLLSVGLIPENDLVSKLNIEIDRVTAGAVVDEHRQTTLSGVFSCGNVLHVHDLADNVSEEGAAAGAAAADFAAGKLEDGAKIPVSVAGGVRYALPQYVYSGEGKVKIFFRVGAQYKGATLEVKSGGDTVLKRKYAVLAPGEMENISVDKSLIKDDLVLEVK